MTVTVMTFHKQSNAGRIEVGS